MRYTTHNFDYLGRLEVAAEKEASLHSQIASMGTLSLKAAQAESKRKIKALESELAAANKSVGERDGKIEAFEGQLSTPPTLNFAMYSSAGGVQ